jgi:hypothetical protein
LYGNNLSNTEGYFLVIEAHEAMHMYSVSFIGSEQIIDFHFCRQGNPRKFSRSFSNDENICLAEYSSGSVVMQLLHVRNGVSQSN